MCERMTPGALWRTPPRRNILHATERPDMTDITIAKGHEALEPAIRFALDNESTMNRDIAQALEDGHFAEPWPIRQTIGPVKPRENPSGMIIQHGETLATWGDIDRVDMTFSISKSYLALLAGIAVDDGLIPDIHAPVRDLVDDGGFDSDQNQAITWAQMLQLTSEWEGTLWDKPDWIDHNRDVGSGAGVAGEKGVKRQMQPPGTHWEYNDVRVNRLSLALMRVFGQALPEVLKERVMDPIGASDTWEWHGYDNSWVEIDRRRMQSVSGGAHWGGGIWISTRDHALVGRLMLQDGAWEGRQIISADWMRACRAACPVNPGYGYLWWLNGQGQVAPAASQEAVFAIGVGANVIWVEPSRGMVVVARWLEKGALAGFVEGVSK